MKHGKISTPYQVFFVEHVVAVPAIPKQCKLGWSLSSRRMPDQSVDSAPGDKGSRQTMLPNSFAAAGSPLSRSTCMWYPGTGMPALNQTTTTKKKKKEKMKKKPRRKWGVGDKIIMKRGGLVPAVLDGKWTVAVSVWV